MEHMQMKRENASHVEDISSSIRTERPGTYSFKIESFSLLRKALMKTELDKCESCHFKAGGYKWMLSVYPNGDKKRGGDGYISLYLALADPKSLPQGDEVHVLFKFFVFDYLRDTYLVLQDGKERRFHALTTEWGFAKTLPLKIFNDPSHGYLVNDCCVFGVEMFVLENQSKRGSSLSIKKTLKPLESTFTWKIGKFTTLPEECESDVFSIGGHKWTLKFYPRGDSREKGKSLCVSLGVHDHSSFACGWKIYAEYKLSVLDQLNEKHDEIVDSTWFSGTAFCWKYTRFMQLSDLKNPSRGFIVKDTAVVELKIMAIFVVKTLL